MIFNEHVSSLCKKASQKLNALSLISSSELMNDYFEFIEKPYSLQTTSHFRLRSIHKRKYGIGALSCLGLKLWNLVPNEYKTIESVLDFKVKIKTWVPENCPFRLCKTFSQNTFYLSSPRDNSRILTKCQYIKK